VGHGIANETYEALPLANGAAFSPLQLDKLDGQRVPFVFLCACMAARVRGGAGGYQTGLASKLVERGAPAVVAFSMPVLEGDAYALAGHFYEHARTLPFGAAAQKTFLADDVPLYARLALSAYGDPAFVLPAMAAGPVVPMLKHTTRRWAADLRSHCVLRTADTGRRLREGLSAAPSSLQRSLWAWVEAAFRDAAALPDELLERLDAEALALAETARAEGLSVHAAVLAERLHRSGLEVLPIKIDTSPESIRRLVGESHFVSVLGGALFDMRLNGLGNSLLGRVITVDQNDVSHSALFLRQAREKLHEAEGRSDFVRNLRADDLRILQFFGAGPSARSS
jgi:hypothetical protein